MLFTKKVILSILCSLILVLSYGQSVKVKKESSRVKGENLDGHGVDLEAKLQDVNSSFIKVLRGMGKVKQSDGVYVLTESSISSSKNPIYCTTKDHGEKSTAWMGINESDWGDEASKINKELEKALYDFGVKFYRDKAQVQIDESIRASQAVEKQQQRYVTDNKNLNIKLEDNKREKIRLEKNLEDNKLEYETLLLKIEKNKHDQDSINIAGEQIKKVIEAQKEKQSKIK
jgi:hypothetical protein